MTCLYHEVRAARLLLTRAVTAACPQEHGHVASLQLAGLLPYREYRLEVRGQVEDTRYWWAAAWD